MSLGCPLLNFQLKVCLSGKGTHLFELPTTPVMLPASTFNILSTCSIRHCQCTTKKVSCCMAVLLTYWSIVTFRIDLDLTSLIPYVSTKNSPYT